MDNTSLLAAKERYASFAELVRRNFSPETQQAVWQALSQAEEMLAGRTRYDSSPLLDHSVGVARIVIEEVGLGRNSTLATLLHDAVRIVHKEQGAAGLEEALRQIDARYAGQVAEIVRGLCNISGIHPKVSQEQADNFRDLIVSYSTDPRVILIKLADRLEVMRSLAIFPHEKRHKKSWESLNLYAQLAHKLGLYSIKSELEDLALSYLEPEDYSHIRARIEASAPERERFIARFLEPVVEKLDRSGIKYHIKSRTKSIFSIWNKMRRSHIPFEEVYDLFALRIIIDCPPEQEKPLCWSVYSIVTDFYTPNPERMRDWISIPKSNGYESLHTTVVTREGRWVEIQIRSERMDEVAERGIAAHWRYKGVNRGAQTSAQWLERLRELIEQTPQALVQRFDQRAPTGEIFVFTPTGDLRKLPEGATVLDFAFDIHSNVGSTCAGARVNHRNVSIKEVLHNGDLVEIITQKNQTPKADWLHFVVTGKARNRIRAFLREERAKSARLGREELERKIKNWKIPLSIDDAVALLCKSYKIKTGTELYGQIVEGRIEMGAIKEALQRALSGAGEEERRAAAAAVGSPGPEPAARAERADDALVIDEQIRNIDYKLAKCCNPIMGDDIFGFVTISTGITIHRSDCPNARRLREHYPYRVLEARWRSSVSGGAFRASIRVVAEDRPGMVNRIAEVINRDLKLNIRSMNFGPDTPKKRKGARSSLQRQETITGTVNVEVPNVNMVERLLYSLMRIGGMQRAYRLNDR